MTTATATRPIDFPASGRLILLRWLLATLAFPIGGYLGHAFAGPAASTGAALVAGLVAGGVIGLGHGIALGARGTSLVVWALATAAALGVALGAVTAVIGPIDSRADAVLLGAVSGVAVGGGQAVLLARARVGRAWTWLVATAIAWAVGWAVTTGIGVAVSAGWPVFGLSGAVVAQAVTGALLWRLLARGDAPATAPA